jgi:hypothetical protein
MRSCVIPLYQDSLHVRRLSQGARNLNDEDVGVCAFEGDISIDVDGGCKGVDAFRQCLAPEIAPCEIVLRTASLSGSAIECLLVR